MNNKSYSEITAKRKRRLMKAFAGAGYGGMIRMIGNPQKPSFIYRNKIRLSMYVHNFSLVFLDSPQGEEVGRYQIEEDNELDFDAFKNFLEKCEQQDVYTIRYKTTVGTPLYLCGFNYEDRDEMTGKYPVFGKEPRIYFTKEKALETAMDLTYTNQYPLLVE